MSSASDKSTKSLGEAIDGLIAALSGLDQSTQITAIRAVCDHLAIPAGSAQMAPNRESTVSTTDAGSAPVSAPVVADIRALKGTKRPRTAIEMACVVAHYLANVAPATERKERVTTEDMDKYFRQAGFPLPTAMQQLLFNAKAAGYFDAVGGGKFRLNPVGYNLVVHSLPRSEAGGRAPTTHKSRKANASKAKPRKKR